MDNQIAVGVGTKHNLFKPADVEHIGLKGTSQMILGPDGNAYRLHVGTTFAESCKVDSLLDAYGELDTKEARESYREQVEGGPIGSLVKEALTSQSGLYDFQNGELVEPEVLSNGLVIGAYVYEIPLAELYDAGEDGLPANLRDFAQERLEDRGWIPAESGLLLTDGDFTRSRFFHEVCAHVAENGEVDSWGPANVDSIRDATRNMKLRDMVLEGLREESGLYNHATGLTLCPDVNGSGQLYGIQYGKVPLETLYEHGEKGLPEDAMDYCLSYFPAAGTGASDRLGWMPTDEPLDLAFIDGSEFVDDVCSFVTEHGNLDEWSLADPRSIHEAAGKVQETGHEVEQVEIYDSERFSDLDVWKGRIVEEIEDGSTHWVETYGAEATIDDISDEDAALLAELDQREDFEAFVNDLNRIADGHTLIALGQRGLWSGQQVSGFLADDAQELYEHAMQGGCDDFLVWDKGGELHVSASHHDGSNGWQVRILDDAGEEVLGDLEEGDEPDFMRLWNSADKPRYAEKIYGLGGMSDIETAHEQPEHAINVRSDFER